MKGLTIGKIMLAFLPAFLLMPLIAALQIGLDQNQVKTIIIDPGHGGIDPGANIAGFLEKDINLAVAVELRTVLEDAGLHVVLSREQDTDLSDQCNNPQIKGRQRRDLAARLGLVEEVGADIFISIHANADPKPERRGIHTFYAPKSEAGKKLADYIHGELQKVTVADNRAYPGDYWVLKANKVPAVIVEVGYITNTEERFLLQTTDHRKIIAEAIARGARRFFAESTLI
ncbi:MAG: N-acetylmuramoyl-L-alanine amidase [Negativicutes bacterium]|nr:N-acetylmuramoyl-L-alanine amidase [Negativicutes bacterium]